MLEQRRHRVWKPGRSCKHVISLELEIREAGFGNRGHFRSDRQARAGRHRKTLEPPRSDVLEHARRANKAELDLARSKVRRQLSIAAIRYGDGLEAGQQAEIFHAQMAGRAGT